MRKINTSDLKTASYVASVNMIPFVRHAARADYELEKLEREPVISEKELNQARERFMELCKQLDQYQWACERMGLNTHLGQIEEYYDRHFSKVFGF